MPKPSSKPGRHAYARHRLFVDESLGAGQVVPLHQSHAHYLFNVLRMGQGDQVLLFNGRDGEWGARITAKGKKAGAAEVETLIRPQVVAPDIWLMFAPLKKGPMEVLVEKAVEMGVAQLCPVTTRYTNNNRLNETRMRAQVIEAAEQCERLCMPALAPLAPLAKTLANWPKDRTLIFANEHLAPGNANTTLAALPDGPAAILIGPEGGFASEEVEAISALPQAHAFSLGPRILRAETAAIAALALWQAQKGDWQ